MANKPRTYSLEEKRNAVNEWRRIGSATAASKRLGIPSSYLYAWAKQIEATPTTRRVVTTRLVNDEQAHVAQENAELKMIIGDLVLGQCRQAGVTPSQLVHHIQQTRQTHQTSAMAAPENAVPVMGPPSQNGTAEHFAQ